MKNKIKKHFGQIQGRGPKTGILDSYILIFCNFVLTFVAKANIGTWLLLILCEVVLVYCTSKQ